MLNIFKKNKNDYFEKDNLGSRHETIQEALAYWNGRWSTSKRQNDPFILYIFDKKKDAYSAMIELSFIHKARDTNKLICEDFLEFGVYKRDDGKFEAILAGKSLTLEWWNEAKKNFLKYGGIKKK